MILELVMLDFDLAVADGKKGWPDTAPYHAIHVGAAAAGDHSHPMVASIDSN